MTLLASALLIAPAASNASGGFHITRLEIIIAIVAVLGLVAILGWRAPDRSPGADDKAQRDRIDN